MSVHSKLLGSNDAVGTSASTVVTNDADHRMIVKCITVQNKHTAAIRVAILGYDGATLKWRFNVYVGVANSSGDTVILTPWIVLNEGQHIEVATTAGTASLSFSGAELLV